MTQTTRSILVVTALLLAACEHGNQAPGALPPMGTYSTPPAQPCVAAANNCAIVPDPYGIPPKTPEDKTPPTITVPDYKDGIITAAPGNAISFLIKTSHATAVFADCLPTTIVSLSGNSSTPESQIFFLGKMPTQDILCTLTATGPNGSASTKVTLHAKAGIGASKPVFNGIPDTMAIKHGTSQTVSKITLSNVAPNAKSPTVSCKYNTPTFSKVDDGSYTFTVTQAQGPNVVDLCSFLAVNPDGEFGTFMMTLTSTPIDPSISPLNFKTDVPLIMGTNGFKCKIGANYAYVDEACQILPQFTIINPDQISVASVRIACTGKFDKSTEAPVYKPESKPPTYQMDLHYTEAGAAGSTESCRILLNQGILDDSGKQEENYPYYEFNFPTLKWQ